MEHNQQPVVAQGNSSREEGAYRNPASIESIEYRIRREPNRLYEDPDIDEDIVYRIIPGDLVTMRQLATCAEHFSSDHGVWSRGAQLVMGPSSEHCKPMNIDCERLRAQCLPKRANNILVVALTKNGRQVGHCFVSQWMHDDDRVWWVTQLLVLKGYRNQRRATRMLQALAMHYDVGRSTRRDLVGVATSNPYTICTILRVFGRGIEVLPSKLDWERNSVRHMPLPSSACESIIKAAPVDYLRDAKLLPGKLTAKTRFFVDHIASKEALKRIVHSINKQVPEPWEWLFGCLEPGYEYVCILDYSFDPEYKMDPVLCDDLSISNGNQSKEYASNPSRRPFKVALGSSRPSEQTPSPIRYAEIDCYLLEVPKSCILDPKLSNRAHAFLSGSIRKLVFEAKELIENMPMLTTIMGAKQIPADLRIFYQSANLPLPLPKQVQTWLDFTAYAYDIFEHDVNVAARMLILQAIQFQELQDNHERSRRERAKKDLELAKAKRTKENDPSTKGAKQEPANQPSVFGANALQSKNGMLPAKSQRSHGLTPTTPSRRPLAALPHGPSGAVKAMPTTPASAPKPRAKSMLSSISPFRRLSKSQRSPPEAEPRGSRPTTKAPSNMPATPEQTPPKHRSNPTVQTTASASAAVAPENPKENRQSQHDVHTPTTPPATPPPSQPQPSLPHYMAPTVGSTQRYKTHSPQLFYSDESDGEFRSNVSGQPFFKNSRKVLDRTQGKGGRTVG